MSETLDFLELVLPPEGDHWYVAAIIRDRVTHRWFRNRLELAACLVEEDRNGGNIYFAAGVYKVLSGGRKAVNSAGAGSLWTDIDAGEGKQYATVVDAYDALVEVCAVRGLPKPLSICSGYGLHAYWPLVDVLDPETWKRYAAGLAATLRQAGIKNERTTDLASLLRPPSTHNRKRATPVPVYVMDHPGGRIPYRIEDLEGLLDAGPLGGKPAQPAARYVNGHSVAAKLAGIHVGRPRYSRAVISGCPQIGSSFLDSRGYVPEPLWHLVLGVFAFIEGDGDQAAHDWSSDDDRYDEQQTQARLDRLRIVTSGASLCASFHEQNPQTCEACPHWGKIKSPIALCTARPADQAAGQAAVSEIHGEIILPQLPEPFDWSNNSLCMVHEDNNGKQVASVISTHAIFLDYVYRREGKSGLYSLGFKQFLPHEGWIDIVINASTVFSAGGQGAMADQGANVIDFNAFRKYVHAAVDMKNTAQQIGTLYEQYGWKQNDTSFLYGCSLYLPDDIQRGGTSVVCGRDIQARTGGAQTWVGPCRGGSLAEWSAIANKLFAAGTEAQSVCLCASFGAVLHRLLSRDEGGAVVSLVTHTGGRGKTTALAGAMSIWGRKEGLTIQNIDSSISRGATLASIGNLPLFYDEFETCDPTFVREFIRMFTNGKDKRRLDRDGSMKDGGLSWQTCLFTASNASLVDSIGSTGNDVLSSRIFEMSTDIPEHLKSLYAGDQLRDSLRNHSGHAGDAFISKLVQPGNVAAARHELGRWYSQIEKSAPFTSEHRFWIRLAATVAVAAEIVTSGERILSFDADRIMTWLLQQMKQRLAFAKTGEWSVDALGQFINFFQASQLVVEGPFVPGQIGANVYVKPTRELCIRKERNGGKVYIARSALRDWCVKQGVNMREFIEELMNSGVCLDQWKYVTLGAGTDYTSARVRCLEIDGRHEKVSGLFAGESGDVLPFRPRVDPNYDDSLGGVSDNGDWR